MIHCRFCKTELRLTLVDLGSQPLANSYLSADHLSQYEPKYPLHARVCENCRLTQVEAATAPSEIFGHYAYFSSYSSSWVEHARHFTEMARRRWNLTTASKVVEVASNDGYLLKHFVAAGVPVLGVEPAANVAEVARAINVPTDVSFFNEETAKRLIREGHAADLIVGNNVFAHVPNLNDFVAGLSVLLKPDGVISLEFPHLLQLIRHVQFDTIYHEHFSYLSLLTTERVLAAFGLRVFDVEELQTHGGSLRVLACHENSRAHATGAGLERIRAEESQADLNSDRGYEGFAARVSAVRDELLAFLHKVRAEGKTVAAYGAAAKGNTLFNYCNVGTELVSFVVDRNPHKQNLYLPGSRLPIYDPAKIRETKPDYVLILPWNLKAEIIREMADVRAWGGKFVTAVPQLNILE
ncbi:class I SAM-dependent methyltransferase [Variovorax sp. dw_954]|uniref:class I SAM-dependent methyltransferase n=1 Tax=Variovorax sp. dw_954 TaxID=2720078 RepID=UPI001C4A7584|nr:class I SAM-dependent methyltransferase [Variovorax sp. dw_954]